jgi:glutathione S-transferase
MHLYFSPLACSMATRIALYEAGADATFVQVDGKAKRTRPDGDDFYAVNPLGLVPALRDDDGTVITENAAVLQYVAERFPAAQLAPTGGLSRTRLQQWLCFIGTELHKATFGPLLDAKANDGAKAYALEKSGGRLSVVEKHLTGREALLDRFSVADAYLTTVLFWARATPVDLAQWPALTAYLERMRKRPSVARALAEEGALYAAEHPRDKKS